VATRLYIANRRENFSRGVRIGQVAGSAGYRACSVKTMYSTKIIKNGQEGKLLRSGFVQIEITWQIEKFGNVPADR
jgi:hypothetical protein